MSWVFMWVYQCLMFCLMREVIQMQQQCGEKSPTWNRVTGLFLIIRPIARVLSKQSSLSLCLKSNFFIFLNLCFVQQIPFSCYVYGKVCAFDLLRHYEFRTNYHRIQRKWCALQTVAKCEYIKIHFFLVSKSESNSRIFYVSKMDFVLESVLQQEEEKI